MNHTGEKLFPLYEAVKHNDLEFARYLLENEANPYAISHQDIPILFYIRTQAMAHLFLEKKVDFRLKYKGRTFLHELAACNDLADENLIIFCADQGADVLACDDEGKTPLHCLAACPLAHKKAALFLDLGVPLDARVARGVFEGFTWIQIIKIKLQELYASPFVPQNTYAIEQYELLLKNLPDIIKQFMADTLYAHVADPIKEVILAYYEHPELPVTESALDQDKQLMLDLYATYKQRCNMGACRESLFNRSL